MFTLARGVIIVAAIFYFSPARNTTKTEAWDEASGRPPIKIASSAMPNGEETNPLSGLWNSLVGGLAEEVVRTAVQDQVANSSLRVGNGGPSSQHWDADTLPAADRKVKLRGTVEASVRCIYRCDGAE
jgi:hypothetical protein